MMRKWTFLVILLAFCLSAGLARAQSETSYSGTMNDSVPNAHYPFALRAGETITVTAAAISGNLDTFIWLEDASGSTLIENDDIDGTTLNSQFSYTAPADGDYIVVVSNIKGTGGDYIVKIMVGTSGGAAQPLSAQTGEVYTGYMSDDTPDAYYPVEMQAGQVIHATLVATDDTLDPYLFLDNPSGKTVAENDDIDNTTYNSEIIYVAQDSGIYNVVVSNYPDTSGNYSLEIEVGDAGSFLGNMTTKTDGRIAMSGVPQTIDTEHFRIHFTLEGADATTLDYAQAAAQAFEESWQKQIVEAGWNLPPSDEEAGGDDRIDVYIVDLLKASGEGAFGVASAGDTYGDNPNTPGVEGYATSSHLEIDNDMSGAEEEGVPPISLMRATAAHEFHHVIQHGYDIADKHLWYYEATAVWMETFTFPQDQDAVGYSEVLYEFPEICFGVDGAADPAGGLMYGEWMFLQSLVDVYGERILNELWDDIAVEEGFAALEKTLTRHDDTIANAVARYRVQNLVRDYDLAPQFGGVTVWLENAITTPGEWQPEGSGVQELGANYFDLSDLHGVYAIGTDNSSLQVWAVGVRGQQADEIPLGTGGVIDTAPYDHTYLIVFNPAYDDNVEACVYYTYSVIVKPGAGTPAAVTRTWDATNFIPLKLQ